MKFYTVMSSCKILICIRIDILSVMMFYLCTIYVTFFELLLLLRWNIMTSSPSLRRLRID